MVQREDREMTKGELENVLRFGKPDPDPSEIPDYDWDRRYTRGEFAMVKEGAKFIGVREGLKAAEKVIERNKGAFEKLAKI